MEQKEVEDIQGLINIFFPFAEELLSKFGAFYPYAGATTTEDEYVSVGFHEENKHLATEKVISNLKASLKEGSTKYKVAAVFYEVKTTDAETGESRDAIAVYVDHKIGERAYEFFYPYKIDGDNELVVDDSYGNPVAKEVFM